MSAGTKLTPQEIGAIISAHTGVLCGSFTALHQYIEKTLGRPIHTHEMAIPEVIQKIKAASFDDFNRLHLYCLEGQE